jgi:predicted RNase H-like nuclease (RuvC/YqgF family)
LFHFNQAHLQSKVGTLEKNLAIEKERLSLAETMIDEKVISHSDYLSMKKEVNDLQGKLDSEQNVNRAELREELVKTRAEMEGLSKGLSGFEYTVKRSNVRPPVLK